MERWVEIIIIKVSQIGKEVIEGANVWNVSHFITEVILKSKDKRQERCILRRNSWSWAIDRVLAFESIIGVGKIEIPKAVNDILCGLGDRIRIEIIFYKAIKQKKF